MGRTKEQGILRVALSYEDPCGSSLMNLLLRSFAGAWLDLGAETVEGEQRVLLPSQAGLYWYKLGVMVGGWRDVKTCSLRTWLP